MRGFFLDGSESRILLDLTVGFMHHEICVTFLFFGYLCRFFTHATRFAWEGFHDTAF